jgi:GntP family gluconate:H+ symporter
LSHNTWLLVDTALAVAALVALIAWLKVNSFVALALVSLAAGLAAGMEPSQVAASFAEGVGNILGKIAVVIGLGSILGQMLAESQGADRIATALVSGFGRRGMALAFVAAGFLIGLPVFFQVGLMLLIPIAETSAERMGVRLSRFGLPLVAGLSVSHGLIPPHPGPMAALAALHADAGKTILFGLLVGAPTALLAGLVFARTNCGSDSIESAARPARIAPPRGALSLATALFIVLLPVGLMIARAIAELTLGKESMPRRWMAFAGDPSVAMLVAVLAAFYLLGTARGFSPRQILGFCNDSLTDVGGVLLIVGAGGGLSAVLIGADVDKAVNELADRLAVSPLVMAWLMAAVVRVATGSATVAISTAAQLVAKLADANPAIRPELFVLAMGAGSLVLSHVNDGGFWLVQKYVRLTVPQTLRTWTVMETMVSLVALALILLLNAALGPASG